MDAPLLYDEWTQVGTDYADKGHVSEYDGSMQRLRDIPQEVERAAQALSLSRDSTVWEIGTGTGEMAIGLASRCRHVYATDVSAPMLALAKDKAVQRGIHNVSFEAGGFLSGYIPPAPVDAVVSQLALHHLPDFWKMEALHRIAQHTKLNGRLFLLDIVFPGETTDFPGYFSQMLEQIRCAAGDTLAEQTANHIREEFSTFDWILEEMLRRAGFGVVNKVPLAIPTAYTCVLSSA